MERVKNEMAVEANIGRIIISRLRRKGDLLNEILKVVEERKVSAGALMVIGALSHAKFGIYVEGKYEVNEKEGPLEIVSCIGNIAEDESGKIIHAHINVADRNGECYGGHLMNGCIIDPTAELIIIEAKDIRIERKLDEETGLKLLNL